METSLVEVAQMLSIPGADTARLQQSVADQRAHVERLCASAAEAAGKLQLVRAEKERLLGLMM
jgi:hypothetical protein